MPDDFQEPEWGTTPAEDTPPKQEETPTPEMKTGGEGDVPRTIVDWMGSRGYESQYESDEQLLQDLESGYAEINRYRGAISDYESNREAFERWKESQGQQPQPQQQQTPVPEQVEPQRPKYAPPEVSDTARQLLQSGMIRPDASTGMFKSTDATLQRFADELTREAQWTRAQAQKLINSPESFFEETGILEKFKPQELNRDELKQELLKEIKAELVAQQQQQTVAQEFNQYLSALYQVQNGQVARNAEGNPIPTELGYRFNQALAQADAYAQQLGAQPNQEFRLRFALDQIRPQLEQQNQQQEEEQPTREEQRQQNQETFLDRARRDGKQRERLTSRDASIAEEAAREATQNDYVNDDELWRRAKQEAEAQLN